MNLALFNSCKDVFLNLTSVDPIRQEGNRLLFAKEDLLKNFCPIFFLQMFEVISFGFVLPPLFFPPTKHSLNHGKQSLEMKRKKKYQRGHRI